MAQVIGISQLREAQEVAPEFRQAYLAAAHDVSAARIALEAAHKSKDPATIERALDAFAQACDRQDNAWLGLPQDQ